MNTNIFVDGKNKTAEYTAYLLQFYKLPSLPFAVPLWRKHRFIKNRWLAWTGPSRTTISADCCQFCGDRAQWQRLADAYPEKRIRILASSSWGLSVLKVNGTT
jgi:hypothetical protein